MNGYALFETCIGPCALAWTRHGVRSAWLPEQDATSLRARIARRHPGLPEASPPATIEAAMQQIAALMRGEDVDLSGIALDLEGVPEFNLRVYEIALRIPRGCTLSYGEIAAQLGGPAMARAVGAALGANPVPIIIPCHRVLAAGHRSGGFSAPGGLETKRRLLGIEGALAPESLPLFADHA